ncbi:MAG: hypothetical protein ACTTIC_08295 [Helicobacteraceae bacterium]
MKTTIQVQGSRVIIDGLVDGVNTSKEIAHAVSEVFKLDAQTVISVDFLNSFAITSSLIGSLLKLVQKDGAKIKVVANNKDLFELFDKLELVEIFNVTRN